MTGALQDSLCRHVLRHRETLEKLLRERPEKILESPTPSFPQMTKEKSR